MARTEVPTATIAGQDLVGLHEIAQLADVQIDTVYKWRQRHADFPPPFLRLIPGDVWYRPEVEEWLNKRTS